MCTEIYMSGYQVLHSHKVIIVSQVFHIRCQVIAHRSQVITDRCPMLSGDMPSDHMTSVNISTKSTTSDNTTDINNQITQYQKTVPIQEFGMNTRKQYSF